MSKRIIAIALFSLLLSLPLVGLPAADGHANTSVTIHLRRASVDPLQAGSSGAHDPQADVPARLLLVQFGTVPDTGTTAALESAGLHPLLYMPDNTFLVRARDQVAPSSVALPDLRWAGPFRMEYKLPAELDSMLSAADTRSANLRLLTMPDADVAALVQSLGGLGSAVLGRSDSLNGTSLHVKLPAAALRGVLRRDDVLWVERFRMPQLHNDKGRLIMGVPAARQQLGLTGAGQIVAVTDTGLDNQANLSADFAGRLVAGFTNKDMSSSCSANTWSDRNGHGTHVSGTVLGSGALSPPGLSFAGVAPAAGLVIQSVSSGGNSLDCLPFDTSYLSKAYDVGARVQNASWGGPTDSAGASCDYGCYTDMARDVDSYLWDHKEHLFVVSAGNSGIDQDGNGVIDPDAIGEPAVAKNVVTVGASESDRSSGGYNTPGGPCGTWGSCWPFFFPSPPIAGDPLSNNPNGMAAFSSRGPTDDGRVKPEIVAPGTNIVSARSHMPSAGDGWGSYDNNYIYEGGTSMSAPMVSGMAALVRQWLAEQRHLSTPSAALVKALLLNGAVNISPGQYGGLQREIPAAWPNSVEGWGRAAITDTVGLGGDDRVWMRQGAGLQTGQVTSYTLNISAGQPLRLTLAWTDYPGTPGSGKQLINDLDLEVQMPDSSILRGNASADMSSGCRDAGGYDRCNNVESVEIAAPATGTYIVRVRAHVVNPIGGPQPFALVGRARSIVDTAAPAAPTLQPIANGGQPTLALTWNSLEEASYYQAQMGTSASFSTIDATIVTTSADLTLVEDVGTYYFRVRACNESACGSYSNTQSATVTSAPKKLFLPLIVR